MQEEDIRDLNKQLLDLEKAVAMLNKKIFSVRHKINVEKQKEYDKIQGVLLK